MTATAGATADRLRYLQPDVVAKLSNMELIARLVVEGFITGLHKSPYHGFSVEFAEHRQYMAGDEIKHIDWKIYGRTDRYYIKQFEEETNLKAYIVLDGSGSMGFASGNRLTKLEYAAYVAAALAQLLIQQRDAVGFVHYDDTLRTYMPPHATRTYLREILRTLGAVRPAHRTATASTLHEVAERIKRRGLVILLSDLFDDPRQVMTALKHFRHKKHEVIVMQVLDPLERSFAFDRDAVFRDLETGETLTTQPWHIQQSYREEMRKFLDFFKRDCRQNNIDYILLDTTTPFDVALFEFLHKRQKMG